jgi:hypothetical protein
MQEFPTGVGCLSPARKDARRLFEHTAKSSGRLSTASLLQPQGQSGVSKGKGNTPTAAPNKRSGAGIGSGSGGRGGGRGSGAIRGSGGRGKGQGR